MDLIARSVERNLSRMSINSKRPLGRPRYRWEDNIQIDRKEIECEDPYKETDKIVVFCILVISRDKCVLC
jgi:hypothetical protein